MAMNPYEEFILFPESSAETLIFADCSELDDLFHEEVVNWEQVETVVNACPTICGDKDKDGMLPLHYACSTNAPFDVISLLVRTWPSACG
jgi:hypothetical protein